jgi:2-polyprenyl-3-methyl-5-hydroxy-6-metoxy-1,4-benzoquinol methylase
VSDRLTGFVRAVSRRVGGLGPTPATRELAAVRAAARDRVIARHRGRADELGRAIAAGEAAAAAELAALGNRALGELRDQVSADVTGPVRRLLAAGDARWAACDEPEYLDDPELDAELRQSIMRDLDRINEMLGSYELFLAELLPLVAGDRGSAVLDLAAGHGGFALASARAASARGIDLRFTASDIKREYLDMGAAVAEREGLDVDFAVQDALDLSNLDHGAYDIITCTQSLHHFPPGLITVMFETAARAAGRGVVFLDGCRSSMVGLWLAGVGLAGFRNRAFAHDAWVSTRRFFVPEELELLARLGSWGDGVESRWLSPGYCLLRLAVS